MNAISTPIEVFYSYADADESLRGKLGKHLSQLKHDGIITTWHKRQIVAGTDWRESLDQHLNTASVILLLISADFMASDYCYGKEMQRALQRHNEGKAHVIPVLLRPCDWQEAPFAKLKVLPSNGIPITLWNNRDAAFTDVAQGIRAALVGMQSPAMSGPSIEISHSKAVRVPFMAPDVPVSFVPRTHEFGQLLRWLLDPQHQNAVAITTALRGAGGFGKTTLAAALCHNESLKTAFDEGILWVTLGEKPDILGALTKLYRTLANEHPNFIDVEEGATKLAEKLADKNCLLVIDDVWNQAHLRPFLRGGKRCARLITTRLLDVALEASVQITVDEMTAAESVQLLAARLSPLPQNLKAFQKLATRLGEWPLMLELANSMLRMQMAYGKTLEGALNWVNQALDKRGVMGIMRHDGEQRKASAAGTLAVSLDLLDPTQREYYAKLAVFAEDVEVHLTTLATLWSMEMFEVEELVQRFADLSLLKFNARNETIHIHDVVRAYLATQVQDMTALHARLIDKWGDPYTLSDPFAWRWYAYHLIEARRQGQLEQLLLDIAWLEVRLQYVEIWVLLKDYELVLEDEHEQTTRASGIFSQKVDSQTDQELTKRMSFSEILPPTTHRLSLVIFMQALQREAHVLTEHPDLLFQQMYNRLQWEKNVDLLSLTAQSQRSAKLAAEPWLHLVTPFRESRALIRTFSGHRSGVNSCAFAPDGKSIISVSRDWYMTIWETRTGREITSFSEDTNELISCAVSPDGAWIVTGSRQAVHANIDKLDYVAEDIRAALKSDEYARVEVLRVWDADTYKLKLSIGAHIEHIGDINGAILSCAVSPNGKLIASASEDGTVRLWYASSGREVSSLKGHEGGVSECAFSPDGAWLVSASADKTLKIWDVSTSKEKKTLYGHNEAVTGCAISRDGKRVVSCSYDGTIRLWNPATGDQELQLNNTANAAIFCCAFGPDDSWIVTGDANCNVRIWDLQMARLRANLYGHTNHVVKCAVSPDGQQIISASYDHTLKLWDINTALSLESDSETNLQLDRSALACVVSSDGRWAISRTSYGDVKQWEIKTGKILMIIPGYVVPTTSCDLSPDGKMILGATINGTLCIWNSTSGTLIRTLRYSSLRHTKAQLANSEKKPPYAKCRFNIDGTRIVAATSEGRVKVWNALNGKKILEVELGTWEAWAINPMGDIFICADGNPLAIWHESNTLELWNLKPGNCQQIKYTRLSKEGVLINDIAVSPLGDIFATATTSGSIILWNVSDGSKIRELLGHEPGIFEGAFMVLHGGVLKCAFSRNGQRLVSMANNREAKVWDVQNARCLATIYFDEHLYDCTWHPDGKQIILSGMKGEYVLELLMQKD